MCVCVCVCVCDVRPTIATALIGVALTRQRNARTYLDVKSYIAKDELSEDSVRRGEGEGDEESDFLTGEEACPARAAVHHRDGTRALVHLITLQQSPLASLVLPSSVLLLG